jgi:hypothetical protein
MTCCSKFGLPSYDLLVGTPGKLYWVLTCVAYLLGLVATFISLFLMNAAQPVSFQPRKYI